MTETTRAVSVTRIASNGKEYSASGLHIGANLVLTADHCVDGVNHRVTTDGMTYAATVLVRSGTRDIDLAILRVDGLSPRPTLPCAVINRKRAGRVMECCALGFPSYKKGSRPGQPLLVGAWGYVPTVDGTDSRASRSAVPLMSLITNQAPAPIHLLNGELNKSEWAGMSGAVVLTKNDEIIGVVSRHAQVEGVNSLGFTPLNAVNGMPDEVAQAFWSALSVVNYRDLPLLPNNAEDSWDSRLVGVLPGVPDEVVDRDTIRKLSRVMDESSVAVVCSLTGLRGVGKTQLANAYARQALDAGYDLVSWIDATTPKSVKSGLVAVAKHFQVADRDGDADKSVNQLQAFFERERKRCLLVFDNATRAAHLKGWLKRKGSLKVLITTTNTTFRLHGAHVQVDTYARSESVALLGRITGLSDEVGADLVADALFDHPLAIAACAAMIKQRRERQEYTYAHYLERLSRETIESWLLQIEGDEYAGTVWSSFCLSLKDTEAESGNPARDATTRVLLGLMAVLAPEGVQTDLLRALPVGEGLPAPAAADLLEDAIDRCGLQDVVTASDDRSTLRMHGLMGRVVRERAAAAGELATLAANAIDLIRLNQFDELEFWQHRALGNRLITHIDAFWATGIIDKCDQNLTADALAHRNWATRQLHLVGASDTKRTLAYGKAVVADAERTLGDRHVATLDARHNLANALVASKLLKDAIRLHTKNLANYESLLGPDDPATMKSRDSLADACVDNKAFDSAISLHTENLRLRENVFGPNHRNTLASRANLSVAYRKSGRKRGREMVPRYQADLADRERVLGANDPDTIESGGNLAYLYSLVGRLDDSSNLYETTLATAQNAIGHDHPMTRQIQRLLKNVYRESGRIADAVRLGETEVALDEQTLGPDHLDTLRSRRDLASDYRRAGRKDVLPLYEETVADSVRILGPDHPETLDARSDLAYAYRKAGRNSDSIALLESVVADRERTAGPEHPATLDSRNRLAVAYDDSGRLGDAIKLYVANLEDRERILGSDAPDTIQSRSNLASAYRRTGRFAESIRLYEAVVADSERSLDPDHLDTLAARNGLALAYRDAGQTATAAQKFEALVADRTRILGPDHPDTLTSRHNLANCTGQAGDPASAARQFAALLADLVHVQGPDHGDTHRARNSLTRWLSEDPAIVVWLELLVAAHLVGRPAPNPDRSWLTGLVSCYPIEVLVSAIERRLRAAVDAQHPNLSASFRPEQLTAHAMERAKPFLLGPGTVCDGKETQWLAPDYLEYTDILARSIRALYQDENPHEEFLHATEWLNLTTTWPLIAFDLKTMR
jgi:tetratricopeptide (TPR) repeat protein